MYHVIARTNHDTGATQYLAHGPYGATWVNERVLATHYHEHRNADVALRVLRDPSAEVVGVFH